MVRSNPFPDVAGSELEGWDEEWFSVPPEWEFSFELRPRRW